MSIDIKKKKKKLVVIDASMDGLHWFYYMSISYELLIYMVLIIENVFAANDCGQVIFLLVYKGDILGNLHKRWGWFWVGEGYPLVCTSITAWRKEKENIL